MNPVLLNVMVAFVVAQSLKVCIIYLKRRRFAPIMFLETGGMPSAHSAVVTTLALSIFNSEGISPLFVLSFIFAVITLHDAMGVRHSVGEQAKAINIFLEEPLKVREGHTPIQVVAGFFLGVIVSFALRSV